LVVPVSAGIRVDRSGMGSKDYLLVLVTTLERLILGLRPFWNRGGGPLQLTAVSARPRSLFRVLPALIHGRGNSYAVAENGYLSCGASEIQLDMDGGFAIDGELFAADSRPGPVLVQNGGVADFLLLSMEISESLAGRFVARLQPAAAAVHALAGTEPRIRRGRAGHRSTAPVCARG
jgi:hypothetical protein